jgi:hypothetical protein
MPSGRCSLPDLFVSGAIVKILSLDDRLAPGDARGPAITSLHSHRFREISWLVDVGALEDGNVVGEQL